MAGVRPIQPEPGMNCWTYGTRSYPLPDDMPDRAPGRILSRVPPQELRVEVGGEVWTVLWWQVTCGDEYQTRSGRWIREPDPRVRDYVAKRLSWARGLHLEGVPAKDQQHWIDHYTWVLQRNGWKVPPVVA